MRTNCAWQRDGGQDPAPKSAAVSRPQTSFKGSNREMRGRVLRELTVGPRTTRQIARVLGEIEASRRREVLEGLARDGLVSRRGQSYSLAEG